MELKDMKELMLTSVNTKQQHTTGTLFLCFSSPFCAQRLSSIKNNDL